VGLHTWGFCLPKSPSRPHGLFQLSACLFRFVIPLTLAVGGTGMFNLFPIVYAFQPRLRGRLTQGRRALPWNPWVFGETDFHCLYRLLMPCILTSMGSNAPFGTSSAPILRSPTVDSFSYTYLTLFSTREFGSML
jgi:hypothetical protein